MGNVTVMRVICYMMMEKFVLKVNTHSQTHKYTYTHTHIHTHTLSHIKPQTHACRLFDV